MDIEPLFHRIRRRKLVQWLIAYAAVGWGLLQVLDFLAENFAWNALVVRIATVIVAIGFLATLVLAWYHGEQGRQRVSGAELALIAGLVLVGTLAIGFLRRPNETAPSNAVPRMAAAKLDAARVAVLPFRNTNPGDQESETLALGIHDDLLTRISRIRALRTVSRTSVEEYRGTTKPMRAIAAELGAGAILEGSVQRAGARVRINVQLIDGATDEHLWADSYDRLWSLDNLFAIQTEIAEYVARALSATLTAQDSASIAVRPTTDEEAYRLYARAAGLFTRSNDNDASREALALLEEAVARDPSFASAWAALGRMHVWAFWTRLDRTEGRLARAHDAIDRALSLAPELLEARTARGLYHYWGRLDYAAAVAEFERVLMSDPDNADALVGIASVRRRQGRMEEALQLFARAAATDPRDALNHVDLSSTAAHLGRFNEAARHLEVAKSLSNQVWGRANDGDLWTAAGDLDRLARMLGEARRVVPENNTLRHAAVKLHRLRRDYPAALHALGRITEPVYESYSVDLVLVDQIAGDLFRLAGNADSASARYKTAARWLERRLAERPEDEFAWSILGLTYAGLGRNEEAMRAAERGVELMPVTREAWNGAIRAAQLAAVYAQVGETDKAIAVLEDLMARPVRLVISPALLRLDPTWDRLRADSRFAALLRQPAEFQGSR